MIRVDGDSVESAQDVLVCLSSSCVFFLTFVYEKWCLRFLRWLFCLGCQCSKDFFFRFVLGWNIVEVIFFCKHGDKILLHGGCSLRTLIGCSILGWFGFWMNWL